MIKVFIMIVMAIVIGIIGDVLVRNNMPGGVVGSMIAGFVGAWLGSLLLGSWGPVIGGFAVLPAILGTAIFVFLFGMFAGITRRAS